MNIKKIVKEIDRAYQIGRRQFDKKQQINKLVTELDRLVPVARSSPPQTNNLKLGYFQVHTNQGTGYICIAMIRPPKGSDKPHSAGFAFCSPKDKFNKSLAREIAIGRLKTIDDSSYRFIQALYFVSKATNNKGALVDALHEALGHYNFVPGWVRKAAKTPGSIQVGLTQWTHQLQAKRGRGPDIVYPRPTLFGTPVNAG